MLAPSRRLWCPLSQSYGVIPRISYASDATGKVSRNAGGCTSAAIVDTANVAIVCCHLRHRCLPSSTLLPPLQSLQSLPPLPPLPPPPPPLPPPCQHSHRIQPPLPSLAATGAIASSHDNVATVNSNRCHRNQQPLPFLCCHRCHCSWSQCHRRYRSRVLPLITKYRSRVLPLITLFGVLVGKWKAYSCTRSHLLKWVNVLVGKWQDTPLQVQKTVSGVAAPGRIQ